VIKKIEGQVIEGERVPLLSAVRPVLKHYFSLMATWLISYGMFVGPLKLILPMMSKNLWLQLGSAFVVGLLIQALVSFLLPAILILEEGFFKGIWKGLSFGARNLTTAMGLVALPMLLIVVLSFFKLLTPLYIRIHPEMVLWVLAVGIVLMTMVDLWVTSSTTIFFLRATLRERNPH